MPESTATFTATTRGAAEYRKLAEHVIKCQKCRTSTAVACPTAGELRHAWSMARRTPVRFCARCGKVIATDEPMTTQLVQSPTGTGGATLYLHGRCAPAPASGE